MLTLLDGFFGNPPLAYDAQAADHDWVVDQSKETSRRKNSRPALTFLSRLTRPLRCDAQQRQFQHAVRWRNNGKLLDQLRGRPLPGPRGAAL